ncbi:BTB/POZ protein [Ochromonadaceae sp. CCMP2298]|nr:BTB/POZ protein [Ochromonadaceae sp. CCMP2298]
MLNPGREEEPSATEEALAEVQQLEQVSKETQEDIGRLVSKLEERKAATVSISDKARNWIADAKERSEEIVQEAEKKAEVILAGATEEIKRWEAEKAELAGVQDFQPIVNLNVGGVRCTTSLTTLQRFPDSMLGCMFSGRHALPKGEDGHFFIDRDGTHFRHILNFLRSPEGYTMELGVADARELQRESEYYGIDELMPFSDLGVFPLVNAMRAFPGAYVQLMDVWCFMAWWENTIKKG